MAAVRTIIDQVAKRNDVPYNWPDETCVQIVIDFARIVLKREIVLSHLLSLSEARASVVIRKEHAGSWFRALLSHAVLQGYGRSLSGNDFEAGDIVEFESPHFVFRGSRTGIGIMYSDDWIYSKGENYILPIPVCSSDIVSAMRLVKCHQ